MDSLGKIITILLAIFLIFLFPLQYNAQIIDNASDQKCMMELTSIVDHSCKQGMISKNEYDLFIQKLHQINENIEIMIEIKTPVIVMQEKNGLEYYDVSYQIFNDNSAILKELENNNYTLNSGDLFTINLITKKKNVLIKLQNLLYPIEEKEKNWVYGGVVL